MPLDEDRQIHITLIKLSEFYLKRSNTILENIPMLDHSHIYGNKVTGGCKRISRGTIFQQHTTATSNKNQMHLLKQKLFSVLLILLINTISPIKLLT